MFYEKVFRKLDKKKIKYVVTGGVVFKSLSGRPQDLADIEALQILEKLKET